MRLSSRCGRAIAVWNASPYSIRPLASGRRFLRLSSLLGELKSVRRASPIDLSLLKRTFAHNVGGMTDEKIDSEKELTLWENLKMLFGASKGFWLVNFVGFGDSVAYFGMLTLLTVFLNTRLGMSDQMTGVSVSMFTGLVTLFMFGGGFVSDRLGVRRALTWSLVAIVAGRALLSAAPIFGTGFWRHALSWFSLFLMAFGEGVIQPATYAGVKEYTDPRTATIGYGLLYSIMNLGIVAENFISPFVRTNDVFLNLGLKQIIGLGWGIDGVFWMCVAITGATLLIHLTLFTKKVEQRDRIVKDDRKVEVPTKKRSVKQVIAELPFFDARFMFFIFMLLPVRTLFAHQFLTVPDYVFREFPAEVSAKFEWINGLNPLIIVLGVPIVTALTRKVNVVTMMIIGTTVSALTTFMLVPGPSLSALLWYVVIFSFGEALWSSRFLEYVADLAPAGKVGAYMGLAGIPWFLAKFTTGLYSGSMLAHFIPKNGPHHSSTLWLIYGIIACISPVGLIASRRWIATLDAKARVASATVALREA